MLMMICSLSVKNRFLFVISANPNRSNNKNKKSYLATIPHITNLDPFNDGQVCTECLILVYTH